MDNWEKTRERLININGNFKKLPKQWEWRIDLGGAYLGGAYLGGAYLGGADLGGADLSRANLYGADLSRADLSRADLSRADLGGADLGGADLGRANLYGADLSRADLSRADLRGAHLSRADLSGADLSRAYLGGADLSKAKISWTSHDLLAELLRREADDNIDKLKIAGLVLILRNYCWDEFLSIDDPLKKWALESLAKWHTEGDDAPPIIIEIAERLNGEAL